MISARDAGRPRRRPQPTRPYALERGGQGARPGYDDALTAGDHYGLALVDALDELAVADTGHSILCRPSAGCPPEGCRR